MPKEERTTTVSFTPSEVAELIAGAVRAEKGLSMHEKITVNLNVGVIPDPTDWRSERAPNYGLTGVVVTITHKDKA